MDKPLEHLAIGLMASIEDIGKGLGKLRGLNGEQADWDALSKALSATDRALDALMRLREGVIKATGQEMRVGLIPWPLTEKEMRT